MKLVFEEMLREEGRLREERDRERVFVHTRSGAAGFR